MLNIGIIGVGRISGMHISQIRKYDTAHISAICDIDETKLQEVGDRLNIPQSHRFTDYRELISCPDVDAVEICTPNHLHVPFALEAVRAGKAVEVEKPLSTFYKDGVAELLKALEESGTPNMICFSKRFFPAVRYAKELIESGKLGQIINVSVEYLQSGAFIPGRKLEWRFVKEFAGSGTLGDLGIHLIDMARFLVGEFESVYAMSNTIVKERRKLDSDEMAPVLVDDITGFMARLEGNVIANFLVTKCAVGESESIRFEIYGTNGVIKFNLNNPEEITIRWADETRTGGNTETIKVPKEYYLDQEYAFIEAALGQMTPHFPSIAEGARCQKILDAVVCSVEENRVVDIEL
ncbi:MAG: Gfo/Idh/MocA family oxidoreductase [Ruminococcaceae bacterium]|nr:Gfo/Idh/MocA family oxidoreductase [Oscillospiraceae bacterium]